MNDLADRSPSDKQHDRDVVKLLSHLFHVHYCVEQNIDPAYKFTVTCLQFCNWLEDQVFDAASLCEAAAVPLEAWEHLQQLQNAELTLQAISPAWFAVILSDRDKPQHEVERISSVILITFKDGTIVPTQAYVHQQASDPIDDGVLATIVRDCGSRLVMAIASEGLNSLYARGARVAYTSTAPEDPFDVYMGTTLKLLPQLKPELQAPVYNFMRLAQSIIRPPIPKNLPQQYAEELQRQAEENKEADTKPRGGWN